MSYEQKLGAQNAYGYVTESVYVFYVLRTGALWSGNIDRVHITFDAPNGGAFVGADGASTASADHIEWDFTNFKPTSDVGTAYDFATPWKEIQAAEAAVNQPGAGPTEFLRAAQDAALLLGQAQHPNGPETWLEQRYGSLIQQWAATASVLGTADSWKALGDADLFASGTIWRFGMRCWPDAAHHASYVRATFESRVQRGRLGRPAVRRGPFKKRVAADTGPSTRAVHAIRQP